MLHALCGHTCCTYWQLLRKLQLFLRRNSYHSPSQKCELRKHCLCMSSSLHVSSPNWMGVWVISRHAPNSPFYSHSGPVLASMKSPSTAPYGVHYNRLTMKWLVCGLLFEELPSLGTNISGLLVVVGLRPFWPKLSSQELFEQELWDNSRLGNSFKWGSPTQSKSKNEKSPDLERGGQKSTDILFWQDWACLYLHIQIHIIFK